MRRTISVESGEIWLWLCEKQAVSAVVVFHLSNALKEIPLYLSHHVVLLLCLAVRNCAQEKFVLLVVYSRCAISISSGE